jgi:hypothetical protein
MIPVKIYKIIYIYIHDFIYEEVNVSVYDFAPGRWNLSPASIVCRDRAAALGARRRRRLARMMPWFLLSLR